ncbi:MAG: TerB family tellurite resistance protein [Alphaproteobacteria bacterium]
MHILGLIVAFVLGVGLVIWKIHRYLQAARSVVLTTKDVAGAFRRRGWRQDSAPRPLDAVDDPMLIAAVVLVLSIRCDRDITQEDRVALTAEMARVFQVERTAADQLLGEAEFLVRDVTDCASWSGRLAEKLAACCNVEERQQVLEMAEAVAPLDEGSERRRLVLARYREGARLD